MKTVYFFMAWLLGFPLLAMNIGSGLYRLEFEVLLIGFVATMLIVGHFPEIKNWVILKYQSYLDWKNQVNRVE